MGRGSGVFLQATHTYFKGSILTQIPSEELKLPVSKQHHEPLAFLSGSFKGSQLNWSIVEKEAFPIVESCEKLRHLLLCDKPFRLFTDHRNLIYIFDPKTRESDFRKQSADKLARWAAKLFAYEYVIEHISGEDNVWADLMSRWRSSNQSKGLMTQSMNSRSEGMIAAIVSKPGVPRPMHDESFKWPTMKEIQTAQRTEYEKLSN